MLSRRSITRAIVVAAMCATACVVGAARKGASTVCGPPPVRTDMSLTIFGSEYGCKGNETNRMTDKFLEQEGLDSLVFPEYWFDSGEWDSVVKSLLEVAPLKPNEHTYRARVITTGSDLGRSITLSEIHGIAYYYAVGDTIHHKLYVKAGDSFVEYESLSLDISDGTQPSVNKLLLVPIAHSGVVPKDSSVYTLSITGSNVLAYREGGVNMSLFEALKKAPEVKGLTP